MAADTSCSAAALVMGRYRLSDGPPLGTGGWCIVRRAQDIQTSKDVAVKTYSPQAVRELGDEALALRFQSEVRTFEKLGVGPSAVDGEGTGARKFLVSLLDFSRVAGTNEPGCDADGCFYTVLELADESLGVWLEDQAAALDLDKLREVSRAVVGGLALLHARQLCHLDVKPENLMRFGDVWKFIDLEGCLPMTEDARVRMDGVTPLYASPELARLALGEVQEITPCGGMDIWAAGVVLLDVVAGFAAFQETKSGCDMAAMMSFEEESVPFEGWYRWLVDPEPLKLSSYLDVGPRAELLEGSAELKDLLEQLLAKDPQNRPSAQTAQGHPFFAVGQITAPTDEALSESRSSSKLPKIEEKAQPCSAADRLGGKQAREPAPTADSPGSSMLPSEPPRKKLRSCS